MYKNLLDIMKSKRVTVIQIAELLTCRQATVSDKINGVTGGGFYFDEAAKIKKTFFPEYEYEYLFDRAIVG